MCMHPRRTFPLAVCSLGIRVGSFHFVYSLGFCSLLLISVFHKTQNGSNSQIRTKSSLLPACRCGCATPLVSEVSGRLLPRAPSASWRPHPHTLLGLAGDTSGAPCLRALEAVSVSSVH